MTKPNVRIEGWRFLLFPLSCVMAKASFPMPRFTACSIKTKKEYSVVLLFVRTSFFVIRKFGSNQKQFIMKPIEYYVYARKSTEDEERQVMSIEDQETEINDFAKREKIKIIEILKESKSAKDPGRKVFNEMLTKIYASKKPVGILAWHPDRLARNSVD
ncbi:MAG TPA: recombinase family protein, partial [Flavobacteriales bacterium]|nr:recombinase family protein [Flavobacteriales bacterium]